VGSFHTRLSIIFMIFTASVRNILDLSQKSDHVRNEEVLVRIKEQRNILHEISKRKANWIVHILRKNCLLQQVIEGKIKGWIEVTRRRTKLLDELNLLAPEFGI
jgi:hypothetical protein